MPSFIVKDIGLFYGYLIKFFVFQKDAFYDIVHICGILLIFPFYLDLPLFFMFLYLSFIVFAISHSMHVVLSQYL